MTTDVDQPAVCHRLARKAGSTRAKSDWYSPRTRSLEDRLNLRFRSRLQDRLRDQQIGTSVVGERVTLPQFTEHIGARKFVRGRGLGHGVEWSGVEWSDGVME